MTDGKTWAIGTNGEPCLVVHKNHSLTIETLTRPWRTTIGRSSAGIRYLVHDGVAVPHQNMVRHPRTVVGLDNTGTRLTILVVDGRKQGVAVGMSYDELATEMLRLGCTEALNLDGGGSSVMAVRDAASGKLKILNAPTDGHERAVADVLGISVDAP